MPWPPEPPWPPWPPVARLAVNVVAEIERPAPAALNTPPPRAVPPAPPLPPFPPVPAWPLVPAMFPAPWPNPPAPPLPPLPPMRLVRRDRALGDAQRPGLVRDPAPLSARRRRRRCRHSRRRHRRRPPSAPLPPRAPIARLFTIATDESDTWPPVLSSPAPSSDRPCWIVTPEMLTLPPRTWKTRSRLLPSMIVCDGLLALDGQLAR